jgi:two-component system, NtrC family, response regulator PilR
MRILLVDDDPVIRMTLSDLFKGKHETLQCENAEEVILKLEKSAWDLVITDNRMGGLSGLDLIRKGKVLSPSTSFFLVTAFASVDQAVEAIRIGADDYVMKPIDLDEMEHRVRRIEDHRHWKNDSSLRKETSKGVSRLIGESKNVCDAKLFIEKVASVPSPVLILGPTGSGKEVLAQAIHETSDRAKRPFVAINCASLSEQLIESELFGHEKGSFTGATVAKPGKFELANGGTIFLDELGELSLELQAKLLRVLQEKEYCRVGGVRTLKTDARVIAATNRDIKSLSSEGKFREDLYFRLNVLVFENLPLSQRGDDIKPLTKYFWTILSKELGRNCTLSKDTLEAMASYSFPGNVRELRNTLERLLVLGPSEGEIQIELLPPEFLSSAVEVGSEGASELGLDLSNGYTAAIEVLESKIIEGALKRCGNNQVRAAALLKLPRGTFQSKLNKIRKRPKKMAA